MTGSIARRVAFAGLCAPLRQLGFAPRVQAENRFALEVLQDLARARAKQLGVLRIEGVVSTRRQGKQIFYSVSDPALLDILAVLYRLYCPKE